MSARIANAKPGTDVHAKIKARTIRGDGCWMWRGSLDSDGYAKVHRPYRKGQTQITERVARVVLVKKIGRRLAPGEQALHKCDRPGCVRPSHIFAGTNAVNMADKVKKGRQSKGDKHRASQKNLRRGEKHGNAKLTNAQAIAIYRASGTNCDIAARYGVTDVTVGLIKRGKIWSSVTNQRTP